MPLSLPIANTFHIISGLAIAWFYEAITFEHSDNELITFVRECRVIVEFLADSVWCGVGVVVHAYMCGVGRCCCRVAAWWCEGVVVILRWW